MRRLIAIGLFLVAATGILFGGPLASGAFWLTFRARLRDPMELLPPWYEPLHKGGIDFGTGLYIREDQDLLVQGALPIALRRTYRSRDSVSRHFGVGATHSAEWYLRGDSTFQWAELILESGTRIPYHRVSGGSSYLNAMFTHDDSPSVFYGSRLGWTGFRWALRWFDGSVAIFRACSDTGPDTCSLVELRSPAGKKIQYLRDGEYATLREIRSGAARITFEYDDKRRIVRAADNEGHKVVYDYDLKGRLVTVTESSGKVRRYSYDAHDAMLTIDEPGWHIENTYDAGGRCIRQVTSWPNRQPYVFEFAYKTEGDSIVETDVSRNNGPHTVYRFDRKGRLISETRGEGSTTPIVIAFERNEFSGFLTGLTVRCYDKDGKLRRKAASDPILDDTGRNVFVAETCGEALDLWDQP